MSTPIINGRYQSVAFTLGYYLHYDQYPLSGFTYVIENLAIDPRCGIRLAHLIGLLLYPSSPTNDDPSNITTDLPSSRTTITAAKVRETPILSQHLKIQCQGHSQKMHNVQIALNALGGSTESNRFIEGINAQDIVSSRREKTYTLLWSLVGKCEIGDIKDFELLKQEIGRLRRPDGAALERGCDPRTRMERK